MSENQNELSDKCSSGHAIPYRVSYSSTNWMPSAHVDQTILKVTCFIGFHSYLIEIVTDDLTGGATRVVNQLLTEMDGLEVRRGVFLMAATNRPDMIDPAVLRPGRLDKILHVGFPTAADRVDILRALTRDGQRPRLAAADGENLLERIGLDDRVDGYTGADLSSLVKEATTLALQEFVFDRPADDHSPVPAVSVHERHFWAAVAKIRPSVSEKERKHYEAMMSRHQL